MKQEKRERKDFVLVCEHIRLGSVKRVFFLGGVSLEDSILCLCLGSSFDFVLAILFFTL